MILQICGNLIDTQYIYNITGIESFVEYGCFSIQFLNDKSIQIAKSYDRGNTWIGDSYYLKKVELTNEQLNLVRDQLITKWKANQLAIPKIEFI